MEVRDEPVDYMEGAARQKIEARGVAIARRNGAFAAVCLRIPGAFQAAGRRGSHGDDAPARRMRLDDGVDSGLRYGVELGVHLVLGRVVLVHDAEVSRPTSSSTVSQRTPFAFKRSMSSGVK